MDLFYNSYIFLHCGKTLGVPILVDDFSDKTTINLIQSEPFESDSDLDECSVVFKWSTNQVCGDKRLRDTNEIPCFLTVDDKSTDQAQYMTADFSALMSHERNNFHRVIEFDDNVDIALDICRHGSSSV